MKQKVLFILALFFVSTSYAQVESKLLFLKVKSDFPTDLTFSKSDRNNDYL